MRDEEIARVCHEANSAYCALIGDPCLAPWSLLDYDTQQSIIKGVNFTLSQAATPESQHEAWRQTRIGQGWQLGPVLDREQKIHPNLIPYRELPAAQQVKDRLFMAIVHALK